MTSAFEIQRSKLNAFLAECGIHPLETPWLEWANVGERTHRRYFQRTSEIISSVLKVVYPGNPAQVVCGVSFKHPQRLAKCWVTKQCVLHMIEATLRV